MKSTFAWGLTTMMLLPLAVGCAQGPGVVRGQNPGDFSAPVQAAAFDASAGNLGHSCPTCGPGQEAFPVVGGNSHRSRLPFQHLLNHGNSQAGAGFGHHPTHYHSFSYEQPQNLVYPPANQPAAVIQYPYYTVKGPSDFFMK